MDLTADLCELLIFAANDISFPNTVFDSRRRKSQLWLQISAIVCEFCFSGELTKAIEELQAHNEAIEGAEDARNEEIE